jgi:hypothetical protein
VINDRAARDVGGEELEGFRDVMMNDDVDISPLSRTTMINTVYNIILGKNKILEKEMTKCNNSWGTTPPLLMSYGAGNSYNRGYENVDDKGADFDYQSYQNGFVNGASTNADEKGRGGSRLFGGFVDAVPSLFRVRRNSKHKEVADINDVLKDTIATNYRAGGTANQTLDTMVKQREQVSKGAWGSGQARGDGQ